MSELSLENNMMSLGWLTFQIDQKTNTMHPVQSSLGSCFNFKLTHRTNTLCIQIVLNEGETVFFKFFCISLTFHKKNKKFFISNFFRNYFKLDLALQSCLLMQLKKIKNYHVSHRGCIWKNGHYAKT